MAAGSMAAAVTPSVINDFALQKVSPDGNFIASEYYGSVIIRNVLTTQEWAYYPDEENPNIDYSIGHGNAFSNTGIMVGSINMNGGGTYWKDGQWNVIDPAANYEMAYTNAITKDGRIIVGEVSNTANQDGQMGYMLVPVMWEDADGDGSYEKETILPHPELDLFGRVPQYCTALACSADGSVIVGQVVDYGGQYHYPIMYTKDGSGQWQYSYPGIDLFNPNHLELPEDPGEFTLENPAPEDYMGEEQKAAYQAAIDAWIENGYEGDYPDYHDYMTDEQKAAYEAAKADYDAQLAVWNEKYDAYSEVFNAIISDSPQYIFNAVRISANGKLMFNNAEQPGESYWDPSTKYAMLFNLSDGSIKKFPATQNVSATEILGDGMMLGTNVADFFATAPSQGYIYKPGMDDFMLIQDYFKTADPAVYTWMEENMKVSYESIDEEYNPIVVSDVIVSGAPFCNDDATTIGLWVYPSFFWEAEYESYTYLLTGLESGLNDILADKADKLVIKGAEGVITLSGAANDLTVYDLGGRLVYSAAAPAQQVKTGLGAGLYLVRATDANGNAVVAKVVL